MSNVWVFFFQLHQFEAAGKAYQTSLTPDSFRMIQLSKSWTTSPSIVAVNKTIGLSVWKRLKKAFNFSETISKIFSLAGKIGSWIMVFSLCQLLLFLRLLKYVTNFFNHQGVIQLFKHKFHFHTTCAHKNANFSDVFIGGSPSGRVMQKFPDCF